MNREEFDIWQKGIYETINESSIIGLSQLKGDVGTHNNRTPEQIKANNEKKASLRAKAVEKMKSAASKAGEAIKNGAKDVAQKTGEVVNKAKNALAGKDDRPIGLSSLNKKPNTNSNSAQKPMPDGAGVNKDNASSTASKFAKGVQNAQANPAPQPKATANTKSKKGEAKQLSFLTSTGRISKKYIPPENRESKTANTQPKTSKKPNAPQLKTDDNKTVTDTVLKHAKGEGGEKKSLGQKLKDTAKKAIYGANDLKYKAGDAKKFVKDAWDRRDAHNKRIRGIKDEPKADTKAEERKGESKENLNKKNNNPQQSNNNRTTASNSNGGSTVHVHVTNHNDEHAKKNAQAKADAEKDREEFFKRANSKAKGGETKAESGEETKTETNASAEEKKESKGEKLSKTTPKTIGKKGGEKPEANAEGNKEEKTNLKSKAKEAKQLSFLTSTGKISKKYIQNGNKGSKPEAKGDNKPEAKGDNKPEANAKQNLKSKAKEAKQLSFLTSTGKISKKYIQNGNKGSKPEAKGDNQPPAEENKDNKNGKPNATDSNKPAVETGDKNTNQGKGKGATNSKNTNKGKGEINKGKGGANKGKGGTNNKKNNEGEEQGKNTPKTIGNKGGSKPATETNIPAEENKDNNQSTAETGDKNANQGKGKGANQGKGKGANQGKGKGANQGKGKGETNNQNTNKNISDKIINIPIDQQAHGRDLSNEKPTDELKPGAAAGSGPAQRLKTTGKESSIYTNEITGQDVPATPEEQHALDKANGKDVVGTRIPKKTLIKKAGTGEIRYATDGGNNPDGDKPDGNKPDGNKPDGNESDGNESDLKSNAKKIKRKGRIDIVGGVRRAQERRQAEAEKSKNEATTATSGENSSTPTESDKNKNQATSTAVTGGKNTNPPADNGDDDKNKNNNTGNAEDKNKNSLSKKELTDEEKAKKRLEIKAKIDKESKKRYEERKAELAKLKAGHEDTRTAEQREKDNKEIINNPNHPNHVKSHYQLSSLDGSIDPETGKQDGKPVDKEKFYKTLDDQAKRTSGSTRASNNASGKKTDAEEAKKKEQEEKNRTSSFIDSVLNSDDDEPSDDELKKIDKDINKYLGKNKK